MAKSKKYKVWLESLGIEVPVYQLDEKNNQVVIHVSDVPKAVAKRAGLTGKTARYWYGPNAGGNNLIQEGAVTEEEKKAKETVETIARNIESLATSVQTLLSGRLKKRAIILLLASASGLPQIQCERVLDAMAELDKTFLK